ncbi:Succinate-semialdehyde dehydrogenase [Fusarium keratoplasticum]|nr:Succinate-semialdehyde dehydrogenase [Fusarium keratoplasticum]
MVTRKVAPALAAGCTVVLKSAGETPFTANALVELAHRAGIAPGVINVITALENTVVIGMLLTTHPKIKKVSFAGSTAVGKILMTQSSGTLKKLSMELSENSPFILFDDCPDLDDAVAGALEAKFRGSGQTCVAANRIFVQEGIHDTFVREFSKAVAKFKVGNGFGQGVTHGPATSIRAVEKMEIHVQDAVAKGAEVIVGGTRLPHLEPTFLLLLCSKG